MPLTPYRLETMVELGTARASTGCPWRMVTEGAGHRCEEWQQGRRS